MAADTSVRDSRALQALAAFVAAAVLALAAASVASPHAGWDGCTSRRGDITFRAADGTRLAGHLFGHGTTAVVLAHMINGNLCQWLTFAGQLANRGVLVLAFDFRNDGESGRHSYPGNLRYGGDVAGAVREVRRRHATKVFLVGASLGGSAVLQAAANVQPRVNGVVSVSGAADLSNAIASVPHLQVPVLYIAAADDTDFAADAKRMYDATVESAKQLEIVDDSRHGTALIGGNLKVRRLVEAFLQPQ